MVEHGSLRGARVPPVVMGGDRVQQLGADVALERARALLDHPQAEVDVTEQAALLRLPEPGPALELTDPADVVQEGGREQEIGSKPGMELRRLAAERRHSDRVLEQAACIAVMTGGTRCRDLPEPSAHGRIGKEPADDGGETGMSDLRCEKLEEAVELVRIAVE